MSGGTCPGILVFEAFSWLDIANPLLGEPAGADQDEMLLYNKPKAEFLPDIIWATPGKNTVPGV